MTHPHEDLMRRSYDAFGQGDLDAVLSVFTDTIRFCIPGSSPVSGVYLGPAEVMAFFGKIFELSGGTLTLEVHDVLANDEHVVVLVRERAERDGKTFASTEAHVWHVSDGKATEFWALPSDQAASDAFWS